MGLGDLIDGLIADFQERELPRVTTAEGTHISVATPRMLYRMKRDTVRPQDRLDAEVIKEEFKLEED